MKNQYEIRGEYAVIYVYGKEGRIETTVDLEGLEKAKMFKNRWSAHKNSKNEGYYIRGYHLGKTILLHRYLTDCPKDKVVDHINLDTLDNRNCNLRNVDHSINSQNQRVDRDTNSGMRGITWNKKYRRWYIYFKVNNKKTYFGSYKDLEEAKREARKAISEIFPYCAN